MCPKWQAVRFPWHTALTAVPIVFFIYLAQPASLYCEQYVYIYIYISDCIDIVYELPLLPNNTASETFLYKLGGLQSVDWIFCHWHGSLAMTG
jgi:hypothetical protein